MSLGLMTRLRGTTSAFIKHTRSSTHSQAYKTHTRLRNETSAIAPASSQPHAPPPTTAQHLKHPSAIGHPALRKEPQQPGSDKALYLTFFGLLLGGMPLSYWYWGYRQEHMKRKKEQILKEVQERYRTGG